MWLAPGAELSHEVGRHASQHPPLHAELTNVNANSQGEAKDLLSERLESFSWVRSDVCLGVLSPGLVDMRAR